MTDDLSDLMPLFLREAGERLERLAQLASDHNPDAESVRLARRELHALKGATCMMRLVDLSEICHQGEELLNGEGEGSVRQLEEIVDRLSAMVAALAAGDAQEHDTGRHTAASETRASEWQPPPEHQDELRIGAEQLASLADRCARSRVLTVAAGGLVGRVFELAQLAERGVNEGQPQQVLATLATTLRQLALEFDTVQRRLRRNTESQLDELIRLQV